MKYSVSYQSSHKQEAEEIKCPQNQLGLLWEFIKDHPEKRYCIEVEEINERTFEQLDIIKSTGSEYTVACGRATTLLIMLEKDYPAFWAAPVTDWETFDNLRDLGVTDIYIDGPLCFSIDKARSAAAGVNLRISPSVSPNTALAAITPVNSFFIRPEDISLYDKRIDIIDFNTTNIDKENVLFNIYKRGSYNRKLSELIIGLPIDVLNPMIHNSFGKERLNCGQKCKIPGYSCHYCDNQMLLAKNTVDYLQVSDAT